ncbi:hypothetical protein DEO72_LG8g1744 [Vigna unguiculata]|uniref:Uncharacterized protein n=1 Tax=Vigna unguiculata TaxID=3917 RepID=A0A4D6MUC2_VIGUN|nr:hypothetical protein DEO72_LG8g1744 [Vigna unguiculata]
MAVPPLNRSTSQHSSLFTNLHQIHAPQIGKRELTSESLSRVARANKIHASTPAFLHHSTASNCNIESRPPQICTNLQRKQQRRQPTAALATAFTQSTVMTPSLQQRTSSSPENRIPMNAPAVAPYSCHHSFASTQRFCIFIAHDAGHRRSAIPAAPPWNLHRDNESTHQIPSPSLQHFTGKRTGNSEPPQICTTSKHRTEPATTPEQPLFAVSRAAKGGRNMEAKTLI